MLNVHQYRELFEKIIILTDNEWAEALPLLKYKSFSKGDYFLKKGVISTQLGFVNSGIMRSYFTVNNREISTFFQFEGSVAVALLSFLQQIPAQESIQALTDTELMIIQRNDLHRLYENNWKWQKIGRVLVEQYYINMEQRMIMLQSVCAKERYKTLIEHQPEIIRNVPLQYIASYLGISPETLSRIRGTI